MSTDLRDRIHNELVDTIDEEIELEIDDHRLAAFGGGAMPIKSVAPSPGARRLLAGLRRGLPRSLR